MSKLAEIIARQEERIRNDWLDNMSKAVQRADLMSNAELRDQSHRLLSAVVRGLQADESGQLSGAAGNEAKELLQEISATRAHQGFTPSDIANFVFSLRQPMLNALRREISDSDELFRAVTAVTSLLDRLSLLTVEAYMATREELISRQQQELLELSTPVVKLWDGILGLPIIGTLDSARTQIVMENLLQTVVETNSKYAIIDITGVPTVDTLVAQHLLKTITAARLMGAECIISGVRPQIAQTIVHLGIDLAQVVTKAKLSDAFALALQKSGRTVVRMSRAANGSTASTLLSAPREE
jgi:rsbT co-antagonist protein RsbR